jgi:hypothetical protein
MARLLGQLALIVASFAACCASTSPAAEPTLALSDRITHSFSKPAQITEGERPLASFALKFTRDANRLEDSAASTDVESTLVESLIEDSFPWGEQHFRIESAPSTNPGYSWTLAHYGVRKPELDPRFVSGSRLKPIECVAMLFHDEFTLTSGVTYTR